MGRLSTAKCFNLALYTFLIEVNGVGGLPMQSPLLLGTPHRTHSSYSLLSTSSESYNPFDVSSFVHVSTFSVDSKDIILIFT